MNSISNGCKENIESINKLVDVAVNEIKKANERANKAQKTLETIKKTVQDEITNAYNSGYNKALETINDDDSGGNKVEEENRLVLKND